jgi:hypothetical protein
LSSSSFAFALLHVVEERVPAIDPDGERAEVFARNFQRHSGISSSQATSSSLDLRRLERGSAATITK